MFQVFVLLNSSHYNFVQSLSPSNDCQQRKIHAQIKPHHTTQISCVYINLPSPPQIHTIQIHQFVCDNSFCSLHHKLRFTASFRICHSTPRSGQSSSPTNPCLLALSMSPTTYMLSCKDSSFISNSFPNILSSQRKRYEANTCSLLLQHILTI